MTTRDNPRADASAHPDGGTRGEAALCGAAGGIDRATDERLVCREPAGHVGWHDDGAVRWSEPVGPPSPRCDRCEGRGWAHGGFINGTPYRRQIACMACDGTGVLTLRVRPSVDAARDATIAELRAQLATVTEERDTLRHSLQAAFDAQDSLRARREEMRAERDAATAAVAGCEVALAATQPDLAAAQRERDAAGAAARRSLDASLDHIDAAARRANAAVDWYNAMLAIADSAMTEGLAACDALRRELKAAERTYGYDVDSLGHEPRGAEEDRDAARYLRAGYGRLARVARREHERAMAQIASLRAALHRANGPHAWRCVSRSNGNTACDCGLLAALDGAA